MVAPPAQNILRCLYIRKFKVGTTGATACRFRTCKPAGICLPEVVWRKARLPIGSEISPAKGGVLPAPHFAQLAQSNFKICLQYNSRQYKTCEAAVTAIGYFTTADEVDLILKKKCSLQYTAAQLRMHSPANMHTWVHSHMPTLRHEHAGKQNNSLR